MFVTCTYIYMVYVCALVSTIKQITLFSAKETIFIYISSVTAILIVPVCIFVNLNTFTNNCEEYVGCMYIHIHECFMSRQRKSQKNTVKMQIEEDVTISSNSKG